MDVDRSVSRRVCLSSLPLIPATRHPSHAPVVVARSSGAVSDRVIGAGSVSGGGGGGGGSSALRHPGGGVTKEPASAEAAWACLKGAYRVPHRAGEIIPEVGGGGFDKKGPQVSQRDQNHLLNYYNC